MYCLVSLDRVASKAAAVRRRRMSPTATGRRLPSFFFHAVCEALAILETTRPGMWLWCRKSVQGEKKTTAHASCAASGMWVLSGTRGRREEDCQSAIALGRGSRGAQWRGSLRGS